MTTANDQARGVLSADGANVTKALTKYRGIVRDHNAAVERILADRKWTAQAKREEITRRHQAVLRQREELRREHYAELERRRVELHRVAFGPRRPADLDAWRAAATSATSLEDQDRALVSLTVARKVGDDLWARALGATALERGWDKVVEAYMAAYPDAREAVAELAAVGSVPRRFEDDMAFSPPLVRRYRIGGRPSWRPNAAPAATARPCRPTGWSTTAGSRTAGGPGPSAPAAVALATARSRRPGSPSTAGTRPRAPADHGRPRRYGRMTPQPVAAWEAGRDP